MLSRMAKERPYPLSLTSESHFIPRLLIYGSLVATLIISPWNYDPISISKMIVVSFIAITGLILHVLRPEFQKTNRQHSRGIFDLILSILALLLSINLLINNYAFSERLFGIGGRNTGFVTLISFVAIAFLASRYFTRKYVSIILIVLCVANLLVSLYYLFQRLGIDPILVTDFYSRPSSTLGNPNFVSGFLGMTSAIPIFLYLKDHQPLFFVFSFLLFPMSIFVIIDSQSIQGVFTIGFSLSVAIVLLSFRKSKILGTVLLLPILAIGLFSLMGLLGKGALAPLLATTTLLSRFDYWRTAIYMTGAHPFSGVGLDGYWDFYRLYRDQDAFERFGESQVSDTPHNVFLDYFASGGFPLGLTFSTLVLVVYFQALRSLLNNTKLDHALLAVFVVFNGYLIQSLISPNAIGIAVWFWILLGCLWAMTKKNPQSIPIERSIGLSSNPRMFETRSVARKLLVLPLLVMVPIIVSPFRTDANFLRAAKSGDGLRLIAAAKNWPLDTKRLIMVEEAISSGGYNQLELETALFGVGHNPNSYQLWIAIFRNQVSPKILKVRALDALKKIEPRYDSIPK